jgi:putative ABC transport system permease protein
MDVLADLRYAVRALIKSPTFALVTIGTLALGIGATTAMFSVVDGVLLKPLPVKEQDRVLVVWTSIPARGFQHWPFSYASYEGIRERLRTVSGVAAHPYSGALPAVLHLDDGSALSLERTPVTADWFGVLGAQARAGRLLGATDDQVGAPDVVVISSALADRLFGSANHAVGRRLHIEGGISTVVGVASPDFDYPRATDVWMPAVSVRDSPYVAWDLVVRVAPGFTLAQVVEDLTAALARLQRETGPLGGVDQSQVIHAQTFTAEVVGEVRPALLMLVAAVLLMLAVAGGNVASLLFARGVARGRELAVRLAIGATRAHLIRHLAAEAIILTSGGAVGAIVVALLLLKGMLGLVPPALPRVGEIGIDGRALAFTLGIALLGALLFGVLPALQTARLKPVEALRAPDGGGLSLRRFWARRGLVVGQIAITMLVLSTAGLLVRSFVRLQQLDVGFTAEDLYLAQVSLPPSRSADPVALQGAMVRLAERVATVPGITSATAVVTPPFAGTQGVDATISVEGQPSDEHANPIVNYEGVDAAYFTTLRLPILTGRGIDGRDRRGTERVVVVNEAFAHALWDGHDPIGRRMKLGSSTSDDPWRTVVGVAADARYRDLATVRPSIYVPYAQGIPVGVSYVAARGHGPVSVTAAIRQVVATQEPGATVVSVDPLPELLRAPLARPRFQTTLAACFAALALVLSIVGTYGLLSFLVKQRRREIGIRIALGATPSRVRALVVRHGLETGALGVLLGTGLALSADRLVRPFLFGVTATDPIVLFGTAASVLVSVFTATLPPTRSATRTDPLLVLRSD